MSLTSILHLSVEACLCPEVGEMQFLPRAGVKTSSKCCNLSTAGVCLLPSPTHKGKIMKPISLINCPSYMMLICHEVCSSLGVERCLCRTPERIQVLAFWVFLEEMQECLCTKYNTLLQYGIWKKACNSDKKKKSFKQQPAHCHFYYLLCPGLVTKNYIRRSGVQTSLPTHGSQAVCSHSYFAQHPSERNQSGLSARKRQVSLETVLCLSFLSTLGLETLTAAIQWCSLSQQHIRREWKVLWFCYKETRSTNLQKTYRCGV